MPKQPGFSLIELMIVVAIIGILAVMAVPSYQTYTRKARFAEVMTIAETYKIAVALALQTGATPNELSNGTHGIPSTPVATHNLANLVVDNGIITATASALATNATYILKPNSDGSSWSVSGSCVKLGYCNA
jgi:prepilin-type N-terminal cleavage/methylation domain-containing protein